MKRKRIIYILVFFIIMILLLATKSFGFEKGDKVKCSKKSYHYEQYMNGTTLSYRRAESGNYFEKGTILTYIEYKGTSEEICIVEYNGNTYYMKEVNLEETTDGEKDTGGIVGNGEDSAVQIPNYSDDNAEFKAGDRVKCNIKSYHYEQKRAGTSLIYQKIEDGVYFKKGTIVTYIESKSSKICEVKYQGKTYMIEENNLVTASDDEEDTGGIGYDEKTKEEDQTAGTSTLISVSGGSLELGDLEGYRGTNGDSTLLKDKVSKLLGFIRAVGTVVSVVMLIGIGIKYLFSSVEEKADYKKSLVPYIIGAALLFSGTTIPQLIYDLVNQM